MKWCAQATKLSVRTNADTPEQTAQAIAFGAVGIGLTRTEHMFFEGDRIDAMREMILADTLGAREAALAKLLPYQRSDFYGIFKALEGLPGRPSASSTRRCTSSSRTPRRPRWISPGSSTSRSSDHAPRARAP
jgi:hypothetical protein